MAIPTLSETLNTEFTNTWYEIRAEAVDAILDATPITALLRMKGVFTPQVGGRKIERTIRYGQKTAFVFDKGDVLPVTEEELTTVAFFDWAYFGVPITRSFQDDQQNQGQFQIANYLTKRLSAAQDELARKLEVIIMAEVIHAGGKEPLSLFDYIPDTSSPDYFDGTSTYTYGGINRDNLYWEHEDFTATSGSSTVNQNGIKTGPASLTMLDDMTNAYNTTGKQLQTPDVIITTQTLFEVYEAFAVSKEQLIRDDTTKMADLGFEVLRFKGKPLTWSANMTSSQMLMITTKFLNIVFDPTAWFDMTSWERPERQLEQVAYILSAMQIVGENPRFNARIKWTNV